MFYNMFVPIIEAIVSHLTLELYRLIDRGFSCKKKDMENTKTETILQYVELYAGPEYFMHFKYSMILNIIFITMMYGVGLPILFPYAVVSLITLYVIEKFMLYYGYRQPPQYDVVLNDSVLNSMKYAPLVLLSFGYWFLSSKQLLSNEYLVPKYRKSIPYDATHDVGDTLFHPLKAITNSPGAGALFVLFNLYFFFYILPRCFRKA